MKQKYLGDGLYAEQEYDQIRLYTQRATGTHEVYINGDSAVELIQFIEVVYGVKITIGVKPTEDM